MTRWKKEFGKIIKPTRYYPRENKSICGNCATQIKLFDFPSYRLYRQALENHVRSHVPNQFLKFLDERRL